MFSTRPFGGGRFSPGVASPLMSPAQLAAGARLGQTADEWIRRARAAVAAFAQLRDGVLPRVMDLRKRQDIIDWLGSIYVDESPEYRWNTVVYDLSTIPERGKAIYDIGQQQNRVKKLEAYVEDFRDKIGAAGALSPTPEPPVSPPPPPGPTTIIVERDEAPDIGTPIAIGLGAVAFAVLASAVL